MSPARSFLARLTVGLVITVMALGTSCGAPDVSKQQSATRAPRHTAAPSREPTQAQSVEPESHVRPGCGDLCQHAGPPAGTDEPGCPDDDSDKCGPCPDDGCAALLRHDADVADDDLFSVKLRCNVDHACAGALHVYLPGTLTGRLAASDISVPANSTAAVDVALTPLGRQVLAYDGEYAGDVWVFLVGTGIDALGHHGESAPQLSLHASQAAMTECGDDIAVGAVTSCPFGRAVYAAYAANPSNEGIQKVKSPVTHLSYRMLCYSDDKRVYCSGGHDAFVTFAEAAVPK